MHGSEETKLSTLNSLKYWDGGDPFTLLFSKHISFIVKKQNILLDDFDEKLQALQFQ